MSTFLLVLTVYLGMLAVVVEIVCMSGRRRRRGDWFAQQAAEQHKRLTSGLWDRTRVR